MLNETAKILGVTYINFLRTTFLEAVTPPQTVNFFAQQSLRELSSYKVYVLYAVRFI